MFFGEHPQKQAARIRRNLKSREKHFRKVEARMRYRDAKRANRRRRDQQGEDEL